MASRKIVVLMLSMVIVAVVTLIPIAVLESRRAPDWQSELAQYLENSGITHTHRVWVAQASRVEQFPLDELIAVPTDWTWQGVDRMPPAGQVLCIRLEIAEEGEQGSQLATEYIVLGDHDDGLWHVGWVMYEFRSGIGEEQTEVSFHQMGCDRWEELSISSD